MGSGPPQVLPIPSPSSQPSQGWGTPILLTPLFLSRRALGPQGAARCHFKRPGSPEPHAEPAPRSIWTRPKPAGLPWGRVPSDRARSPSPGTPWAQRTRRPRRCGSWWARRAVSIGGPRPQFPLLLRKGFSLATVGKSRGLETRPKTVTCAPHAPPHPGHCAEDARPGTQHPKGAAPYSDTPKYPVWAQTLEVWGPTQVRPRPVPGLGGMERGAQPVLPGLEISRRVGSGQEIPSGLGSLGCPVAWAQRLAGAPRPSRDSAEAAHPALVRPMQAGK